MAGIEEVLALDYADALAGADDLERRLTEVAATAAATIDQALTGALDTAQAAAELVGETVATSLTSGAEQGAAALDGALTGVLDDTGAAQDLIAETIAAGASAGVEDAQAVLDGLAVPDLTVVVDDTQVTDTAAEVAALDGQTVDVDLNVSGAEDLAAASDGLGQVGQAAQSTGGDLDQLGLLSSAATGGIAGLSAAGKQLFPTYAAGAAVLAGAAVGVKTLFDYGVAADAANRRLAQSYGDQVDALQDLSDVVTGPLPKGVETLKDLTLATGSSGSGLKVAIANYADLGRQAGATNPQLVETGRQFGYLANYVAATRPELGTADVVAGRLATTLARGGRFAAQMGLDVGSSAGVAERAAIMYGKPVEALTLWEKSTAGLTIALEKLGPAANRNLAAGLDNPIVQMRALERELKGVLATAGQPLVEPLIGAMTALEPVVLVVAESFGKIATSSIPGLVAAAQPLLTVLELVANVLHAIPGPVFAAGAAFLLARKEMGLLLNLATRVAPALAKIASVAGMDEAAAKLTAFSTRTGALAKAMTSVATTTEAAAAADEALSAELSKLAATNALATRALDAHSAAVAANTELVAANVELGEAQAALRIAEARAAQGVAGADAEVTASKSRVVAAQQQVTTATEQATAANALYQASVDEVVRSELAAGGAAGSRVAKLASDATAANTAAAAAGRQAANAGASAGTLAGSVLPALGIALGVGAAAWAIFGAASKRASEDVQEARDSLDKYREGLGLTNRDLANLDTDKARQQFENAGDGAQRFFDALGENLQDDLARLGRLGVPVASAGKALNGSAKDARAFREGLLQAGEVSLPALEDLPVKGEKARQMLRAIRDEYVRTGGDVDGWIVKNSRVGEVFEEQLAASERLIATLRTEARTELEAGNARDTNAIASLAAAGALDSLGAKGERQARALLLQSDALTKTTDETTAFQIAAEATSGTVSDLVTQVGLASTALQQGVDPGAFDVAAARALVASRSFADLPKSVQDAANGLVDYADKERQAAAAAGELVSSTGELSSSLIGLADNLDKALQKYDELNGAAARGNAANRDVDRNIRGVAGQVDRLGTSLDAQGAKFDAAAITAENYQSYLDMLPDSARRAVEAIDLGEGADPAKVDAAKADATRAAITGNAEALAKATTAARDNADSLLDYFDSTTEGIRKQGEEVLKVFGKQAANDYVAQKTKELEDQAVAAGISREAFERYLATTGIGLQGLGGDLSQVDAVTSKLGLLNLVIAQLPPEKQVAIRAMDDATEQTTAIQDAINALPPEKRVAIQTALNADSLQAADFAISAVTDVPRAVQILADTAQLTPQIAQAAVDGINAWNANEKNIAKGLELPVTVEAATAVAALQQQAAGQKAEIKIKPGTEEYDAKVREIDKDLNKAVRVYAETGSLQEAQKQLGNVAKPETKQVDVKVNVPEWAKRAFGIGTKKEPLTGEAVLNVTTEGDVPASAAREEGAGAQRGGNQRQGRRAAGGRVYAGRTYSVNEKRRLVPPGSEVFVPDVPAEFTPPVNGRVLSDVAASSLMSGASMPTVVPPMAAPTPVVAPPAQVQQVTAEVDGSLVSALERLAARPAGSQRVFQAGAIQIAPTHPDPFAIARAAVDQLAAFDRRHLSGEG